MSERLEVAARVLRRNWWLPGGGLAAVAAAVLAARILPELFGFALFVGWVGGALAIASTLRNSYPLSRAVALAATRDALQIGAERVDVADLVEAKLVPKPGRGGDTVLVLTMRGGRQVSLWMRHVDASQLLDLLGLGAGDARASFRLISRFRTRFGLTWLLLGAPWMIVALLGGPSAWVSAVAVGVVWGSALALGPALLFGYLRGRLEIGADGFSTRWFRRTRLHRFADVHDVTSRSAALRTGVLDVIVTMRDGRRVLLRAPEQPDDEHDRGAEGRALLQHLAAAHARFTRREVEVDLRRQLERGGRSDEAWLSDLDALLRGGGARYRIATIEPEQVAVVVRDPLGAPEQRIAAAAALVRFDPAYRAVVQRAADACAEVELRATMEALSIAADDEAIRRALRKRG